jgi:diguanylate cyclase (GGDEF)-like protein
LRVVGRLLLEHARAEDIVCRYGGEEFLLVLPKMPPDIARVRAEELLALFRARTVSSGALSIGVTASIGIAAAPLHADDGEGLIRWADQALYQAKRTGRNRVVVFGDPTPAES